MAARVGEGASVGSAQALPGGYAAIKLIADQDAVSDQVPRLGGHTLVVPRAHHETLADLPVADVGPLFEHAQRVSRAMETALAADGSFVAMNNKVSQSVPHLHVHVVPRRKKDGLKGFFWPRTKYASDAEAAEIAAKVRSAMG